jgi:DNA polymerase-3 subunit epsilon
VINEILSNRNLAIIDIESTGTNPKVDRIVEITVLKITIDGKEEIRSRRINPEITIPEESIAIHGITNEDVKNEPTFKQYASSLSKFLENCDLAGFGIKKFDIPILEAEFRRCGINFNKNDRYIIDALTIYHKFEPRDLSAAYRKYCGKELLNPHDSKSDVEATKEVLMKQIDFYDELPKDIKELHLFCNEKENNWIDSEGKFIWRNGEAIINFGIHMNKKLSEIALNNKNYLQWIIRDDFADDTKKIALDAINGIIPRKAD